MESSYRTNILKWLPIPNSVFENWFLDVLALAETINRYVSAFVSIIHDVKYTNGYDAMGLARIINSLTDFVHDYKRVICVRDAANAVFDHKINHLLCILNIGRNAVVKYTEHFLIDTADCKSNEFLQIIFRMVNKHNNMVALHHRITNPAINIFVNDCPPILELLEEISFTHILRILARNQVEEYCDALIYCILSNYETSGGEKLKSSELADAEISENSSIEIYRVLTKHMTSPIISHSVNELHTSSAESIATLLNNQKQHIETVLNIVEEISPLFLNSDCMKLIKGEAIIKKKAHSKISEYFVEVAWDAISSMLDHVFLWWFPESIAPRHNRGIHNFRKWLHQFRHGLSISPTVQSALRNLYDTLGCYLTITTWDQQFTSAYISSFGSQTTSLSDDRTNTGEIFTEVFRFLVTLSNENEITSEWTLSSPLLELPLPEQIIVLHRLDHSIHMMRMWVLQESTLIAHTWKLDNFFHLVKNNVVNALKELLYLKLADHSKELMNNVVSVQVMVCAKMRAKIICEVHANFQLLKDSPSGCIKTLASICRHISLANLQRCFPRQDYWRKSDVVAAGVPSFYVRTYFGKILLPVLEVVNDQQISNMILKILCEAWLDYIYLHRIQFSKQGALQLLTDFAFATTWIRECPMISQDIKAHLLKNEVLRQCEGVGRLLFRNPGEAITMHQQPMLEETGNPFPESVGLERMPAEMYVPNQEQWLELRAAKHCNFYCSGKIE